MERENFMERKSTKKKIQRRIQKTLALLLAFALVLNVSSVSVFAAVEQESGNAEINGAVNEDVGGEVNAAAQADDVEITGDGPMGDMLANALSEEQARTEEAVHITSLSMNGAAAAVKYNTQGTTRDCDLVVAVYAESEEPRQMLASGTVSVPGGGYRRDCICKH